eukprot:GHVS01057052.1.p1 GENE.GHVS01057052.1~~GHVS01057052.1.p1  ORF type:complete len:383 (+),score=48.81 GHVS01057052.1:190-1338(+)
MVARHVDEDGFKHIGKYKILCQLTHGNLSKIMLCTDTSQQQPPTNEPSSSFSPSSSSSSVFSSPLFVVKRYNKFLLSRKKEFCPVKGRISATVALDEVRHEVEVCKTVDDDFCVRTLDVVEDEGDSDGKLFLIMEYGRFGSVLRHGRNQYELPVNTMTRYAEPMVKWITYCALKAVQYLHSRNICHRDLKPLNLFVFDDGVIRLGDFGSAEEMSSDGFIKRTRGTYAFLSPECVEEHPDRKGHDGRAADIWAVGMTTWALFFHFIPSLGLPGGASSDDGNGPWAEYGGMEGLFNRLAKADYQIPEEPSISEDARKFLTDMLNRDYDSRIIRAEQALQHPWLRGVSVKSMESYLSEAWKCGLGDIPPRGPTLGDSEHQCDATE